MYMSTFQKMVVNSEELLHEEQIMTIMIPNKLMLLCMVENKPYKKESLEMFS